MAKPGLRPFWRYYSAKWRIAPRYPAPRHQTIIEPFAGAAGYSLRYPDRDAAGADWLPFSPFGSTKGISGAPSREAIRWQDSARLQGVLALDQQGAA